MKLPWQRRANAQGEEQGGEIEFPDELKTRLENAVDKSTFDTKMDELRASLGTITARFQREDEERIRAAEQKRREAATPQAMTKEQLEELMATDPVGAVQRLIKDQSEGSNNVLLAVRADNLRREVFEDTEKYPFYTGDLKSEIDKLIEGQTLAARNDRSVIEHAYYSTLGKHHKELSEGKLKSRFASSDIGARTSTGTVTPPSETDTLRPMTDEDKKAAKILGFSEQDYQKLLKEDGVGYA